MIKFRIHGRGGQGGVTLAKILAFMYWTEGKWVQAFGNYSAERTGAPLLAFTLVDDIGISNRSKIYYPDHLIIVDPTLLGESVFSGLQPNATIVIDTPKSCSEFSSFKGHRVATIDAKKIARKYKLGTKATPITNTAIAGAMAKIFNLDISAIEKTIKALNFPDINLEAAKEAYDLVEIGEYLPGEAKVVPVPVPIDDVPPLITGNLGTEPSLNVADWKSQEPLYAEDHVPPCNFNCPAGNNIQKFIEKLAHEDYNEALSVLKETTPLPGTTSRVCPHPCETFCNRMDVDERINIHSLERLASDKGLINITDPEKEQKEKIAIIGSGPAGLTAAYHLRRNGYKPVIFEAHPEPGGMLVAGIPEFRLPRDILKKEIQFIIDSGVEIRCNSAIESKEQFDKLVDEYDAVIIAVGLSIGRNIGLEGSEAISVMQGIEFLKDVNFGKKVDPGKKVVVIGGGNTAIDASRTSLRVGADEVSIVYRRSREEMPAIKEEIDAAAEEGVNIRFLHSPHKVVERDEKKFLEIQKMELGEPDDSGRRRPVPVPEAYDEVEFDTLILATGQTSGLGFLKEDIKVSNGFIETDDFGITSNNKVFASGDIVTNDGTVTHAIGEGRKVALAVQCMFKGIDMPKQRIESEKITRSEDMNLYYFNPSKRNEVTELPSEERIKTFEEVNLGLEGVEEAFRCMSCGVCNTCYPNKLGKCELFCPERTIKRISATELSVNYEGCKGCLICMEVCPRNAIEKRTVKKEDVVQ